MSARKTSPRSAWCIDGGTGMSGWCIEGKHGEECKYKGCICECHKKGATE